MKIKNPYEEFGKISIVRGDKAYTFKGKYVTQYSYKTYFVKDVYVVYLHEDGNYVLDNGYSVTKYSVSELKKQYPSLAGKLGHVDEIEI